VALPSFPLPAIPMQNLSAAPPATSCRSGAVVHLLRSNGVRVPVTLRMSTHDDGEHVQHVVRVVPASEAERLDRQRLILGVGEDGEVVSVNPGATTELFGFDPQVRCAQSAGPQTGSLLRSPSRLPLRAQSAAWLGTSWHSGPGLVQQRPLPSMLLLPPRPLPLRRSCWASGCRRSSLCSASTSASAAAPTTRAC
jgi:hypothetical protein